MSALTEALEKALTLAHGEPTYTTLIAVEAAIEEAMKVANANGDSNGE